MATVVVDANFGVGLVRQMPHSGSCRVNIEHWITRGYSIAVPNLWDYEVVSALFRLQSLKMISKEAALSGIKYLFQLNLIRYPLDWKMAFTAASWSEKLNQHKAYDGQYLALAERLNADFYTADKKLFNRCQEIKAEFVYIFD